MAGIAYVLDKFEPVALSAGQDGAGFIAAKKYFVSNNVSMRDSLSIYAALNAH